MQALVVAFALLAATAGVAQPPPEPSPLRLVGEAIGYLALSALLVVVLVVGPLVGGREEERPDSP